MKEEHLYDKIEKKGIWPRLIDKVDTGVTYAIDGVIVGIPAAIRFPIDYAKFFPYYLFGKVPYYLSRRMWYCNKIGLHEEKKEYCRMSGKFNHKIFAKTLCDHVDEKCIELGIKHYYCKCMNKNIK